MGVESNVCDAYAEGEAKGLSIVAPGLPPVVKNAREFITDDCVKMPESQ